MGVITIYALCLITLASGGTVHHPRVHEDQIEHNRNNNVRTVRNLQAISGSTLYQAPSFNFRSAKQQDYLKRRYAQQQMADFVRMANAKSKNFQHHFRRLENPNAHISRTQRFKKDTNQWQPFEPLRTKQNAEKIKLIHPIAKKNVTINQTDDLDVQASEVVLRKEQINRKDSSNALTTVLYVPPNYFKKNADSNVGDTPQMLDVNNKNSEMQITVLNELIGKNPNVQLEGLKRLIEGQPMTQNHISPVVKGPQPFQIRDHASAPEQVTVIPNSQGPSSIQDILPSVQIPQLPAVIDKESLEGLQKQFDEASKLQAEQFLARAQQEAQAEVEAQHKAIALAQAAAQKTALENFEKGIYGEAVAAPLIQGNQPQLPHVQHTVLVPPQGISRLPHSLPITDGPPVVRPNQIQEGFTTAVKQQSSAHTPRIEQLNKQFISAPSANNIHTSINKAVASSTHDTKKSLHYAPNHQHQAVAQNQAQKALLAQVQAQNNALLDVLKASPANQHQQEEEETVNVGEDEDEVHIATSPRPSTTQRNLNTAETRSIQTSYISEDNYDDPEELQYAAKYAFGYRIKDANEGNDFGHEERRNGKSAEGSYHVLLPDGRLQKVQYYADQSGYHARVTYEHVGQNKGT